jgi:sec-independent protein translocase protein TatA
MNVTLEVLGFGLGASELLIILAIVVLIFGASRIPELGKSLGAGIRGFQKSLREDDEPKKLESENQSAAPRTQARTEVPAAAPTAADAESKS